MEIQVFTKEYTKNHLERSLYACASRSASRLLESRGLSEELFDIFINNSLKGAVLFGFFNDCVDSWNQRQTRRLAG